MVTGKWDGSGDRPRGASKSHPGDDESIPAYMMLQSPATCSQGNLQRCIVNMSIYISNACFAVDDRIKT